MGRSTRKGALADRAKDVEKEILMELADELLQDNYGSLRFRQLIAQTDIEDTGLRWQVSNEITRRLVQHVLTNS
jgi:hypothetical protein